MSKIRYQNEKMKRKYFDWAKGALGLSIKTLQIKESALWKYDEFSKHQDYRKFNSDLAKGFKKWLETKKNTKTGNSLSKSSQYHVLRHVNEFFNWLSLQSTYKSKIRLDDVAYLRLSKADTKIATASKLPKYPTLNYIKKLCEFDVVSEIDKRDRALIAFTALSGMRDLAIVTLPIGCFDVNKLQVEQDPSKGVKTKFSKTIYTTLFRFDEVLVKYVVDWYYYLRDEKLFDNSKPLFPSTNIEQVSKDQHSFTATGVSSEFWANTSPMRKIFRARMESQNLEYYSPHKFRHFAISEANKHAMGAEQMKAISQNVGHERLTTTFYGYGAIDNYRVADIIGGMDFTENRK